MALDQESRVGIRGLNLGADPTQLAQGTLTLADGVRFVEAGAAHSRNGRVRAGLSFPLEAVSYTVPTQTIAHFVAPGRVRGFSPFYDQRIETRHGPKSFTVVAATDIVTVTAHGYPTVPDGSREPVVLSGLTGAAGLSPGITYYAQRIDANTIYLHAAPYDATPINVTSDGSGTIESVRPLANLPARLNFVYKSAGKLYFNDDYAESGSGIIQGDGNFRSQNTRAKIVPYGDRVYIVDESTDPKVFRRRPRQEQGVYQRVKYDVRRMGVLWPTATSHVPTTSYVATGSTKLETGLYRFRIVLENKHGTISNPSMPVGHGITGAEANGVIRLDWAAILNSFPGFADAVSKVRIYVQFTADATSQTEPSAYVYWKSVPTSPTTADYTRAEHDKRQSRPLMQVASGAPPQLLDLQIINDIAYAIPTAGIVYREVPISDGESVTHEVPAGSADITITTYNFRDGRGTRTIPRHFPGFKYYDNTQIKEIRVDPSYLFWSRPGEPEAMENWVQIGQGGEVNVGLAGIGGVCVVFTNVAIYTFNGEELRRVYSKVGCLSRDSIVETEHGIRFLGSDGIPRIFNGATVDEISNELLPIFDREDFVGDYALRFDKANAQECQGTFGDRKFFFTFPVTSASTNPVPGTYIDPNPQRFLAIGDASRGPTAWTIDRPGGYEIVYWLGRESRLLGINTAGEFYFLEEGFVDQKQVLLADDPVYYDIKFRKFASAGGLQGQFYRLAIDANTQGETLTVVASCDDVPSLVISRSFSTARRDEFKMYLPAKFKGRFLDVRIFGTVSTRVAVYGVTIELAPRGVF